MYENSLDDQVQFSVEYPNGMAVRSFTMDEDARA